MNEWERLQHEQGLKKRWGELDTALRKLWGTSYEHKAYYARKVLDAGGERHLQKLSGLELSAMVQLAEAYYRAGQGQGRLSPTESRLTAEIWADRGSEYYSKDDPELHAGAKSLVADLFADAAGDAADQPSDPTQQPVIQTPEPSLEAKEEAQRLMRTKEYWSKSDQFAHDVVRRKVQELLSGASTPPAQGQPRPPAPTRDPEAEAKALMRRPEYWESSKPGSESVRAQVRELMAEAYPQESPAGEEGGQGNV